MQIPLVLPLCSWKAVSVSVLPAPGQALSTTHNRYPLLGVGVLICTCRDPQSRGTGPKTCTTCLLRTPIRTRGSPLAGLASSPAYGGAPIPGDQARSTVHGVGPIRGMHTLNHAHYSWDECLSLHTKCSPVEGRVPSTPKKGVPTLGPHALNWGMEGFLPASRVPSTA